MTFYNVRDIYSSVQKPPSSSFVATRQTSAVSFSCTGTVLSVLASQFSIKRGRVVLDCKPEFTKSPHCGKAIGAVLKQSVLCGLYFLTLSLRNVKKKLLKPKLFSAAYKLRCNLVCQLINGDLKDPSQSLIDDHMQGSLPGQTFYLTWLV